MLRERLRPGIASTQPWPRRCPPIDCNRTSISAWHTARTGDLDRADAILNKRCKSIQNRPIDYNELGMVQRRKGQFLQSAHEL